MPYTFKPGMMYRMPTHFGPSLGPRQGEGGRTYDWSEAKSTTLYVSFLTDPERLEALLPPGFSLGAEPVVTVAVSYLTQLEWLAGRGYNTLGVSFPAAFQGERDRAEGSFLTVLWENLADPIITGREDLGFAKIYCEIPEPRIVGGETRFSAGWLGFTFMDLVLRDLEAIAPEEAAAQAERSRSDGTLHYKYMPRTGEWGEADAAYAVLTPAECPGRRIVEAWRGQGRVAFHRAAWEDLPTMFTIVNTFVDLEVREWRGAGVVKTVGAKDLRDQRRLV